VTSSNAASNNVDVIDVKPTSQLRAVSLEALLSAAATDDDDFLDFSRDDIIFHQHFRSIIYNDDDRALQRTFSATHYCHTSKLHGAVEWMQQFNL